MRRFVLRKFSPRLGFHPNKGCRGEEQRGGENQELPVQAQPGGHTEPARYSQALYELHQGEGLAGVVPVVGAEEGDDLSVEGGVPQPHQGGGEENCPALGDTEGGGGGVSQGGEVGQEQEGESEGRQVSQETK